MINTLNWKINTYNYTIRLWLGSTWSLRLYYFGVWQSVCVQVSHQWVTNNIIINVEHYSLATGENGIHTDSQLYQLHQPNWTVCWMCCSTEWCTKCWPVSTSVLWWSAVQKHQMWQHRRGWDVTPGSVGPSDHSMHHWRQDLSLCLMPLTLPTSSQTVQCPPAYFVHSVKWAEHFSKTH